MCMCKVPSVNGTPNAYSWNDQSVTMTYQVNPPAALEGDDLVFDEPGRCERGKCDSHSHHMRLYRNGHQFILACRHGGGDERYAMRTYADLSTAMAGLDSNPRYWMLLSMWMACREAAQAASFTTRVEYNRAIMQKRVRVRSRHGQKRVEIMPELVTA